MPERDEQLDRIAEYADSSVRVLHRTGSLATVPGSYGAKRALYARWGNVGNAIYTFTGSLLAIAVAASPPGPSRSHSCFRAWEPLPS